MINHDDHQTGTVNNQFLILKYLLDAGPRIVGLYYQGLAGNFLAEVPDRTHSTSFGTYHFHGGHRLWHAPEHILRTYIPDNDPILVTQLPNGIILTQPVEQATGVQKSIQIDLIPDAAKVFLRHSLKNEGLWPIKLSAWALTQLPLEGFAVLPQNTASLDAGGLLPNRNLSLWSYTKLNDPRLILADDLILIKADPALPPVKIGYTNRTGWIGYIRESTLFIKHFTPYPEKDHPDFGCNVEVYCGDAFIELETLSPFKLLHPGQSLSHDETWEIIPNLQPTTDLNDVRKLLEQLKLP